MKRYSKIFLKIHRKTVVAESHFNKVLNLQNDLHNTPRRVLFFEFSENFWNSFYTKHIWRAAIYIFLCRLIFEWTLEVAFSIGLWQVRMVGGYSERARLFIACTLKGLYLPQYGNPDKGLIFHLYSEHSQQLLVH